MSTNISFGTYVSDGLRSGPFYTGQLPNNFVADNNGIITSGSHSSYGPGVLFSPQTTWSLTPAQPNPVGGFTTHNNVVALTADGAVPAATNLTLRGDNSVTYYNNSVVQFDWPRIVTVTVSGANATANTRVTIFGTDWYGLPLQHTYVVAAQQTYPVITLGGGTSGDISVPAKAFFTVNRVYVNAGLPAGCRVSLGAADVFGLPFLCSSLGTQNITSIGWDNSSELCSFAVTQPLSALGVYLPGTTIAATAISGDVRGLYGPSSAADSVKKLLFTYYVEGADVWTNQVANIQQLYMQNTGSATPQGVAVAPLNTATLYGVPQFYTGNPS